MRLALDEDQQLIAKTAADFAADRSPVTRFRALRDGGEETCFSRELWSEMAELGWLGIPFAESHGGAGMGLAELVVVVEALGRQLAPEPYLSCIAMAGSLLAESGSAAQQEAWLVPMIKGESLVSVAYQEAGARYSLSRVGTTAERSGEGWQLRGKKLQVLDGQVSDAFIVSARTSGQEDDLDGVSLFLVPRDAPGLKVEAQVRMDSRGAAIVELVDVVVPSDAVVGDLDGGCEQLGEMVDRATVVLCSEMLGGMSQAFELTLAYLKEREQFGARIGTFQGLKHRAARIFMEIELSRSTVMAAARAIDEGDKGATKLVSLAKARCTDAYLLAANEGVQMFAGVGMTDEYDIGLYLKRARAAEFTFGDAAHHRDRWARLSGY
jgi:alkylation response protein AidB-like acyl-CoA dehydrogenase